MNRLLRKIEAALAAVAFAEEGDAETARRMLAEPGDEPGARPEAEREPPPATMAPHVPIAKGSRA